MHMLTVTCGRFEHDIKVKDLEVKDLEVKDIEMKKSRAQVSPA
ncbi:hypothetical protein [Bradyrhizobium quebecense]|nr:hypothetical protein [Bradyrhizobium quebecense]